MESLPKRKSLRIEGYDYDQPGAYFITICTFQRARLFGSIEELSEGARLRGAKGRPDEMLRHWLGQIEVKYPGVAVDYFMVMPDHVHIILMLTQDGAVSIPRILEWYKTMTTNAYIREVKRGAFAPFEKHVWQRGYYDHVIRNDEDLYLTRKYIQENPIRWINKHTTDHG